MPTQKRLHYSFGLFMAGLHWRWKQKPESDAQGTFHSSVNKNGNRITIVNSTESECFLFLPILLRTDFVACDQV